jgi:hypothetical protein
MIIVFNYLIKWRMTSCCEDTFDAARDGHVDCLKAMRDPSTGKIYPWHEQTTSTAAYNGRLDVLKILRNPPVGESCPWHEATLIAAVRRGGRLECLKFIHNPPVGEPCPWHEATAYVAVHNDSLDCLKYIFEEVGSTVAPWDERLETEKICFSTDIREYLERVKDAWKKKGAEN